MFNLPKFAVLVALIFPSMLLAKTQPEPVNIPGTSVSMVIPNGYELSNSFTGLGNPTTKSSIIVMEMPSEANQQFKMMFSNVEAANKMLFTQGVNIVKLQDVDIPNGTAALLSGSQTTQGVTFEKHMALIQGEVTALVTYNLVSKTEFTEATLIESIKSIVIGEQRSLEDKLKSLPFSFKAQSPFKVVDVFAGASAILTTGEGVNPSKKQPVIVIGSSLVKSKDINAEKVSLRLVNTISGFKDAEIVDSQPVQFATMTGHRVEAVAEGRTLIQYLAVNMYGQHIRLGAVGETKELDKLADAIEIIAGTVKMGN